ncbi:MAG: hypothetical protein J5449_09055, partial [Oscillospiraceae bacterium]|nr:hypothetical protein [Oscillospiraceae bacterium]
FLVRDRVPRPGLERWSVYPHTNAFLASFSFSEKTLYNAPGKKARRQKGAFSPKRAGLKKMMYAI